MKKEANFSNTLVENSNKKYERGERNDVTARVRKKLNFGNEVAEIVGEERENLRGIVAMKLPKMKEKKIVVMKLLKIERVN